MSRPYQRVVASKVLQMPNITAKDVDMMGLCVCQADVQDLERFSLNTDVFFALKRNLFACVRRGDLVPDSQMLEFLIGDSYRQGPEFLSWQSLSDLSAVIPALSYNFLQAWNRKQLLLALPEVGSARLRPIQAQVLLQKILNTGNISEVDLSNMGSLVLGLSPMFLQKLSASQLEQLLPSLATHSASLSNAQTLAVIRTLWASWNVTQRLQEVAPFLSYLPLSLLRTWSKELLSAMNNETSVTFNQQQALLLFREVSQQIQSGVRTLGKSVTGNYCDLLKNFLENDVIQSMPQLHDIINSLPPQLIQCALDEIDNLPSNLLLMNHLSTRNLFEITPSVVSLLPVKSCRTLLKALKAEPWFLTELPRSHRTALLEALTQCLSPEGSTSPLQQFVAFGVLTPFLKGSRFLSLYRVILKESVERVTNYCYPQETRLLLAKLLQESQRFGPSRMWTSTLLERIDRLVPLLPVSNLKLLNTTAVSMQWLEHILSEERAWRTSHLGSACQQAESAEETLDSFQRQRTLLTRSNLNRLQMKVSASIPSCSILRDSIVSAWSINSLLGMENAEFMDCLEEIGQDLNIPSKELALLLGKVVEVAGPTLPSILVQLGRLATKFSEQQLREISLDDWQVIEAFGKEQEWTMGQLNILASGFMTSHNITAQDLSSVHLVTLGHLICGFPEEYLRQIRPSEFCIAVMYLGQLSLPCTEQQLYILTHLCATSKTFGAVSEWTRDVFQEMGSVAAGLDDMELSALVLEQIEGLTPQAISLIQPKKFAVSFSAQQLQMFSWSQAKAVTDKQQKLLDKAQRNALTLVLAQNGETQTSRGTGKSHASHCTSCLLLQFCRCFLVLYIYYFI